MSRDMKPRKPGGTRNRSSGGTLLGLFIGLVIGVIIAAGVVWYIYRTPPPLTPKAQSPAQPAPRPAGEPQAPLALPGKPGDPAPQPDDKPRFDFYKILPGETAPATPTTRASPASPTTPATAASPTTTPGPKPATKPAEADNTLKELVFLQTGSFLNAGDADNQKARLAMMGMDVAIQQVMLQDKVWYRVRLGPFRKVEEVDALRAELARQGIEANIVRKD